MPTHFPDTTPTPSAPLLPLGAMFLATSFSALAQESSQPPVKALQPITVTEHAEEAQGKDSIRATSTSIGKGKQDLRDIPQSITVVTEKLIDDRRLDTLKDVLHNTAGVTFQAAEGGEEDIRLRGFSLAQTGDIFLDGMRDPAFYDRDTFNNDRIELLRGSAALLFGRGSTGGAVNQVSKQARAFDESEVSTTVGSYKYARVTGDFNIKTGDDSALRINAMDTKADNNGAGSKIDKKGLAANYRFGIGTADEVSLGIYSLENKNGNNIGVNWVPVAGSSTLKTLLNVSPTNNYGLASDYNNTSANNATISHTHRFEDDSELKTQIRSGVYKRDLRTDTLSYAAGTNTSNISDSTVLKHDNNNSRSKIQDFHGNYAQSDYSTKFDALGFKHEATLGVDLSNESKNTYTLTGTTSKGSTTIGTPNTDASYDESSRPVAKSGLFEANSMGFYGQDLVQIAEHWKVLGGLRYDRMSGSYTTFSTTTGKQADYYSQSIGDWSQRVGLLFQPNELDSYHFSWGTSFNTSADTYSYASSKTANTPPEQSRNIELGAKLDSMDKRYTTRFAIFHSVKFNERNTDPDSSADAALLSGKRHTSGLEMDVSGLITPKWEIYGSYMWMPDAIVDEAASTASAGDKVGERPSLTPIHSGTVWSTYQFLPALRLGAGVNFRSEQQPNRNPGFYAPGYATLDLMGEYKFNEKTILKVNLNNALDKLYADALYTSFYVPGAGRNLQATLTVKF